MILQAIWTLAYLIVALVMLQMRVHVRVVDEHAC